ncbi:D-glycerate 3-kinase [Pseudoxanthomonas wuyuanensis]|uniref:D-glycerate 3-kinase n=2 Tax=Pseudoxanthomonas wuyuanensis TaxID=1073196 RepID=A0A286DCS2_9GAMM|nr:D-glycerate 3-kinase [Pseudoxanthomonas wuyuanensis]
MRYCLAMVADPHVPAAGGFPEALVAAALDAALALPAAVPVFAISGLQGSGKSTLAAQMAALASRRGRTAAVLSIDDFYLGKAARQRLARDVHPLLATRGPPGTHDVGFACATLDALKQGVAAALPRFDKLADDTAPRASWPVVAGAADLVIIEGWLLGTPAEDEAALAAPVNALERDEDADGRWRRYCNDALRRAYPALWRRFDALWFLQPPGFEAVSQWRWQQEQQLAREQPGKPAMDYAQVQRFIGFFERVSRQALRTLPGIADRTIPLDAQRNALLQ